jgi:Putative metal-binding motif
VCTNDELWDVTCTGAIEPAATDTCDAAQLDEDCDGTTDEGCDCIDGESGECEAGPGVCSAGSRQCVEGKWGACMSEVAPLAEACDGALDEDCDDKVDEGCGCTDGDARECTDGVAGICRPGKQMCAGGEWTQCASTIEPKEEECDGRLDEDCDGEIDEDCQCTNGKSRGCTQGVPESCRPGSQTCESGRWGSCEGTVAPKEELCDGRAGDEDCDGMVDEGCECTGAASEMCQSSKPGICKPGMRTCSDGEWGQCVGGEAQDEVFCDGQDNDCDMKTDECPARQTCKMDKCLASGSYIDSCSDCSMSGNSLRCGACEDPMGRTHASSIDLTCDSVLNCSGQLSCKDCFELLKDQGSFDDSCDPCSYNNKSLTCTCKKRDGTTVESTTRDLPCPAGIHNIDGMLVCG